MTVYAVSLDKGAAQQQQFDYSEHALMSILVGEKRAMKISYVGWD